MTTTDRLSYSHYIMSVQLETNIAPAHLDLLARHTTLHDLLLLLRRSTQHPVQLANTEEIRGDYQEESGSAAQEHAKGHKVAGRIVVEVARPDVGQAAEGVDHGHATRALGVRARHVQVHGLVDHDLGTRAHRGEEHHGEVARCCGNGGHGDGVSDHRNGEARDDDVVHHVLTLIGNS